MVVRFLSLNEGVKGKEIILHKGKTLPPPVWYVFEKFMNI